MVTSSATLSPSAVRTRRYRQRQRDGERCFQIQMTRAAVDALVQLDLLKPDQCGDPEAVRNAVLVLCHVGYQTLTAARGDVTRDVVVRVPEAVLHQLVTHGFVRGGRWDEAAIAAGCRKAECCLELGGSALGLV